MMQFNNKLEEKLGSSAYIAATSGETEPSLGRTADAAQTIIFHTLKATVERWGQNQCQQNQFAANLIALRSKQTML
jgi:hypothetical protein